MVQQHFPESDKTQKWHMKKQRQRVWSTRRLAKRTCPPIEIHNATKTMHSNQTGCFPTKLSRENKFIMVLVEVDGNYIDAEQMKNKSAGEMIKAYLNYGPTSLYQEQWNQQCI
jgi:hypothetical protein